MKHFGIFIPAAVTADYRFSDRNIRSMLKETTAEKLLTHVPFCSAGSFQLMHILQPLNVHNQQWKSWEGRGGNLVTVDLHEKAEFIVCCRASDLSLWGGLLIGRGDDVKAASLLALNLLQFRMLSLSSYLIHLLLLCYNNSSHYITSYDTLAWECFKECV